MVQDLESVQKALTALALAVALAPLGACSRTPEPIVVQRVIATPLRTPNPHPSTPRPVAPKRTIPIPRPVAVPRPQVATTGDIRTVDSTAYSETGVGACGGLVGPGTVAMGYGRDHSHCGQRWRVLTGPFAGQVLTVADTIGHGSEFDIWTPNDDAYGRHEIQIVRVA